MDFQGGSSGEIELTDGKNKKVVVAFSGGLDTSFCVAWLKQQGYEVVTAVVDTGGFTDDKLEWIERRSKQVGAVRHHAIDRRREVFDRYASYLIKGNILRGQVYPLSVAAERVATAVAIADIVKEEKADAVAHGSTAAGNDQVRFDIAFSVLLPEVEVLTPIRDLGWSRAQEVSFLRDAGIEVQEVHHRYSINEGLWGVTIGGAETLDSWEAPPEVMFVRTRAIEKVSSNPQDTVIRFENGIPTGLDGAAREPLEIVQELNEVGAKSGVGRGIHLGETVLGIKGRVAFEAPAPLILVQAHRELEKLVLTKWQLFWKNQISEFYGQLLHEGQYFDPVMRDFEAMIDRSQGVVTGDVRVQLHRGNISVTGCRSPFSLLDRKIATYGEETQAWNAEEVRGFAKFLGMPSRLAALKQKSKEEGAATK